MAADQAATSTLCNSQTAPASGGQYTLQNNKYDSSATSGQPNGAEVMIWLNHDGSVQPFGSQVGTARSWRTRSAASPASPGGGTRSLS
jgi:hypothetical protein